MLFSQIANILEGDHLQSNSDIEILYLAFDSRKLTSGTQTVFFALLGNVQNGHKFIIQAYEKGVRCFVVSEKIKTENLSGANIIVVDDTLFAVQKLSKYHREQFQVPVIGITGSNGKTIVKEWLADLLSEKFNVVKSPKSYNSQLGVPLSVWEINESHEIAVFEAGISKKGEMLNLQKIINPSIGIFTNIGAAHDEGFVSRREKLQEKASLFSNCEKLICCADQPELFPFLELKLRSKLITWSRKSRMAQIYFQETDDGYSCQYQSQTHHFNIQNHHGYYLENLLHVITAALLSGLSNDEINQGIKRIRPVAMRLELKRGFNDCYILDDTYNNDLTGLAVALDYLKRQSQNKKKTVILSDIEQSGIEPSVLYNHVNDLLVKNNILRFIGIGPSISEHKNSFKLASSFYASTSELLKRIPAFDNELILIKGARSFSLEKIVALLEEQNHGTVLEVNFESLTHNLSTYRKELAVTTKLMVMVKAFAYGGGLSEIANLLQYQNVDYLGVAYLDEGVALRRKGITIPIMVMNPDWDHLSLTESFDLEPEIYSLTMLKKFIEVSENPTSIHLKIETGMNRLGFREEDLNDLTDLLNQNKQIKVAGVFTHFAGAEEPIHDEFTKQQADRFNEAYNRIVKTLGYLPIKHALNSSGIIRWPDYHFDMVRLGIGLYGYDSSEQSQNLKPISVLKSRISQIRTISKGESIGYSRKGMAAKETKIAIVSIGYADGYLRMYGNGKAYMVVNNQQAQTIGNVCMDMTMLDVTDLDVNEGDEVTVFGQNPNIEDLAEWAETIPYEILTNVSQRVKRVFVSE